MAKVSIKGFDRLRELIPATPVVNKPKRDIALDPFHENIEASYARQADKKGK